MSDKELIARGAEVVTGDLILGRTVVGQYRNGQFILTPEGAHELNNVVEVQAKEVAPATRAPRVGKKQPAAQVPSETDVTDTSADATAADVLTGTIDDILKD